MKTKILATFNLPEREEKKKDIVILSSRTETTLIQLVALRQKEEATGSKKKQKHSMKKKKEEVSLSMSLLPPDRSSRKLLETSRLFLFLDALETSRPPGNF